MDLPEYKNPPPIPNKKMEEVEIKLMCIQLAIDAKRGEVLNSAKEFYRWVTVDDRQVPKAAPIDLFRYKT